MTVLTKAEALQKLLNTGNDVFVHLDSRRSGVFVPETFVRVPQVVLQLGLNLAVPMRRFDTRPDGFVCDLTFSRTPFYCIVPWPAVYIIVTASGNGYHWKSDTPPEVLITSSNTPPAPGLLERTAIARQALLDRNAQHVREDAKRTRTKLVIAGDALVRAGVATTAPAPRSLPKGWRVLEGGKKNLPDGGKEAS